LKVKRWRQKAVEREEWTSVIEEGVKPRSQPISKQVSKQISK